MADKIKKIIKVGSKGIDKAKDNLEKFQEFQEERRKKQVDKLEKKAELEIAKLKFLKAKEKTERIKSRNRVGFGFI